jgi:hypothetical protein
MFSITGDVSSSAPKASFPKSESQDTMHSRGFLADARLDDGGDARRVVAAEDVRRGRLVGDAEELLVGGRSRAAR